MEMERDLPINLQEDESVRAFRELVAEVVPQGLDGLDRATQVRFQARAKAQDYLNWLRQRQDGRKVSR
ncbi:MAG: hypothetical protein JXM73_14030 [Anaerolineae bacterium]|nr:hypothetical protein [Anaerolineae bacterium]